LCFFQWSAIFPNEQVTSAQSALFVKKLLAVAVSNIAYLRAIFPEHAFGDRSLEGNVNRWTQYALFETKHTQYCHFLTKLYGYVLKATK